MLVINNFLSGISDYNHQYLNDLVGLNVVYAALLSKNLREKYLKKKRYLTAMIKLIVLF